jgi:alkaline phosphatase
MSIAKCQLTEAKFFHTFAFMKKKLILSSVFIIICIACAVISSSFVHDSKPAKPRKVIFLIGDGMGLTQISGAMSEYTGRNAFERFKVIGFSKTRSADNYVTDSGAGATVFSIGKKTFNGAIGVGPDSLPSESLFEKLKKKDKNWATGVVVTSSVTHATPGSFFAHVADRDNEDAIAMDFLKGNCDIAIGGGYQFFMHRKDEKNLFKELQQHGFVTVGDTSGQFKPQTATKLLYTLANDGMKTMQEGRGDYLKKATLNAMNLLSQNKNGYMLMVEGSQIDWGGHAMNYEYMKTELHDFNEVINAVLDEAEKAGDILVVVTADHETGGLALTTNKENHQKFTPKYTYNKHTGVMVPVFAYGPGAEEFAGIYENNTIFNKFLKLLDLK